MASPTVKDQLNQIHVPAQPGRITSVCLSPVAIYISSDSPAARGAEVPSGELKTKPISVGTAIGIQ